MGFGIKNISDFVSGSINSLDLESPATRRGLLSSLGAMALAGSSLAQDQPKQSADSEIAGDNDPWQNWQSPTNRLVRRITMGINLKDSRRAAQVGYQAYLEEQLNATSIDDSATDNQVAKQWPRTTWPVKDLYGRNDDWISQDHLIQSTVYRSVKSKRQLQERMVEFWCDHFNMWSEKASGGLLIPCVREVIRPLALTNFPALLRGVLGDPAMLIYLDNAYNYGDAPNINFAREVLELHTVSVTGGYTGTDIKNLARALTGWSINDGVVSVADKGKFQYRSYYHSVGQKVVMGHSIPMGQQSEGEDIISWLSHHPKTAEFISKKLVKWFVSHDPDPALVQQVTGVYMITNGDIKAMLRVILAQSVIANAPAKLKRPYHLVTSALRTTTNKFSDIDFLRWAFLPFLGQVPFAWEAPDGYPDRIDYWAASMQPRLQYGYSLANNEVWGFDYQPIARTDSMTISEAVNLINQSLFGNEMSTNDRNSLQSFLTTKGTKESALRGAYAIALASPSFQYY